jgi:hypothetical protein
MEEMKDMSLNEILEELKELMTEEEFNEMMEKREKENEMWWKLIEKFEKEIN